MRDKRTTELAGSTRAGSIKTSFRRRLLRWYGREARDLPWRRTRDPYVVWLSEVLLQQTQVDQGAPYFVRFLDAFPTVEALAAAPEDRVMKLWEGLGYYTRARNLHEAAKRIVDNLGGRFPRTDREWRRLPGVGRYTAGAIASIAFGQRVPAVDGNVKRVLGRVFNIQRCMDDAAAIDEVWRLAGELVKGKEPGRFNQALMELGACVCVTGRPRCGVCPVDMLCEAHARGVEAQRPVHRPKKTVPRHEVVVAAIAKNGRYLIGKRAPNGLLGSLWEFPAGRLEQGEMHHDALTRIGREFMSVDIVPGLFVASVRHAYSHFRVVLHVYRCAHVAGSPQTKEYTQLKWVRPAEFARYAFHKANHKFIGLL